MIIATCHCGAVRLEVPTAPTTLTDCNCSICRRLGTLWAYYPPDQVKIVSEPDATLAYSWGERWLTFHTCKTCGCTTHWAHVDKSVSEKMGINSRLMDPGVTTGLRVRHLDGADTWTELACTRHPVYLTDNDDPSERATSIAKAISELINLLSWLEKPSLDYQKLGLSSPAELLTAALAALDDLVRLTEPELMKTVRGGEELISRLRADAPALRELLLAWGGAGQVPEPIQTMAAGIVRAFGLPAPAPLD